MRQTARIQKIEKIDLNTKVAIPFIWDATDLENKTCTVGSLLKDGKLVDSEGSYGNYLMIDSKSTCAKNHILNSAKIAHIILFGKETLGYIIGSLIENRISNPVCGINMIYGFGSDIICPGGKYYDEKVNLTFHSIMPANKQTVFQRVTESLQLQNPDLVLNQGYYVETIKKAEACQKILDEALSGFTTIYYSLKYGRIMSEGDMSEILSHYTMFKFEPKSRCKHFKLKHIDVWILDENLDALLDFEKLRSMMKKIFALPMADGVADGHHYSRLLTFLK